jgi:protein-L-isoaspartate(D-aspartate) O-methyltransferase
VGAAAFVCTRGISPSRLCRWAPAYWFRPDDFPTLHCGADDPSFGFEWERARVGSGDGFGLSGRNPFAEVHTIEILPELAAQSEKILQGLGCQNVHCHLADGSLGWTVSAPYDGILATAAAPSAPQPLLDQLAQGGRLVLPVGDRSFQELEVWRREGKEFKRRSAIGVAFVLMRGEHGWKTR